MLIAATFDWSNGQQESILSSFYYGYFLGTLPYGAITPLLGGKKTLLLIVLIPSLLNLVTPVTCYLGVVPLFLLRLTMGLFQAGIFATWSHLAGLWSPESEISCFSTVAFSGANFANVIVPPAVGYLSTLDLFDGWPIGVNKHKHFEKTDSVKDSDLFRILCDWSDGVVLVGLLDVRGLRLPRFPPLDKQERAGVHQIQRCHSKQTETALVSFFKSFLNRCKNSPINNLCSSGNPWQLASLTMLSS